MDGGDDFDGVDSEMDADVGIGFQFITFKNLVGFFTIFGWIGIACINAGFSKPLSVIIALVCGLLNDDRYGSHVLWNAKIIR